MLLRCYRNHRNNVTFAVTNDVSLKQVLVVSAEAHFPYMRPPLTKDLWNSEDPKVAVNLKFKNWEGVESS